MDWIDLAEERVKQWTSVNTVTDLRVPRKAGNFLTS